MAQTLVAVYGTHHEAILAVDELRKDGFPGEQISVLAPDPREVENYAEEMGATVVHAGAAGVVAGGVLGGISGWLAIAIGLVVPGVGPFLIAGALATVMVGAVGGASLGGLLGLLMGLGLPHTAAAEYERELKAGRTLVLVHPNGEYFKAELALERAHPMVLHRYDEKLGCQVPPAAEE